jgi:hypothetical protein
MNKPQMVSKFRFLQRSICVFDLKMNVISPLLQRFERLDFPRKESTLLCSRGCPHPCPRPEAPYTCYEIKYNALIQLQQKRTVNKKIIQ